MENYDNIRDKIIIDNKHNKFVLDKLSDIELAARHCENKINYGILEFLLEKNRFDTRIIDKVIRQVLRCGSSNSFIIDTLKMVIKYGADLNYLGGDFGETPLIEFCGFSKTHLRFDIIKFLIENGTDVNIEDEFGCNALDLLCKTGNSQDIINIELLLEYKANVNNMKTSWSCLKYAVYNSNYDIAKLLIENGANINYQNSGDDTILNFKCSLKSYLDKKIIKLLVENGADVNIKNKSGKIPLTSLLPHASIQDDFEIIKLLIYKGSNVNIKDIDAKTPLMIYFEAFESFGSKLFGQKIIKLLLDNKADIYLKNKNGENILDIVKSNSDIYELIFNYKNIYKDALCKFDIDFIY